MAVPMTILMAMGLLDSWTRGVHTGGSPDATTDGSGDRDGASHPTYRKGEGPGVVIVHEIPGLTPAVIGFAEEVVAAGYTVVMPHLFGTPEAPMSPVNVAKVFPRLCVSREFTMMAVGRTSPVAGWLRSLARSLHQELGGPGVGALGMCFTGGFALAMMVDTSVAAPVVAQPALPFAIGKRRAADLNLSPADLAVVRDRAASGCQVLGLRYRDDPAAGSRFDTLTRELGDAFIRVELDGKGHSTLTEHRQQAAVDRVLAFFDERLR
jgi:dienelactone hydrolase